MNGSVPYVWNTSRLLLFAGYFDGVAGARRKLFAELRLGACLGLAPEDRKSVV